MSVATHVQLANIFSYNTYVTEKILVATQVQLTNIFSYNPLVIEKILIATHLQHFNYNPHATKKIQLQTTYKW
jgi:hypothetical protein